LFQVGGSCGLAWLVVHHAYLFATAREAQNRLREVRASSTIKPRGSHDVGMTSLVACA
jgi:hypothetical protein